MTESKFTKVVHPLNVWEYNKFRPVFCEINIKDGELSITGVVGPQANGDAWGGCGQIDDTLRNTPRNERKLSPAWTPFMFKKFLDVWDTWHLNDMHPECEHQAALGWMEKARQEVTFYKYHLNTDIAKEQNALKKSNENALILGDTVQLTPEQITLLLRPWSIKTTDPTPPPDYVPDTILNRSNAETKTLGWLTESEHPEGILSRPCPTCGYKYGSSCKKVELPADVIEFLESLPDTDITPAWV